MRISVSCKADLLSSVYCSLLSSDGIIISFKAKDEELRGDMEAAQRSRSMCILFSIGAILFGCAMVTVAILFTAGVIAI